MLGKLLKYDLKDLLKSISVFYILSFIGAILTRIFGSLTNTIIIEIIKQVCMGFMFSMLASSLINTLMRNWVRFKQTLYGDESYLTHTLPVTKKEIIISKLLLGFINMFITFVVIIISLLIAFYTKENYTNIINMLDTLLVSININSNVFIVLIIIMLFLEIFAGLVSGYLGIILGFRKSNNKVGYSVLLGFIVYIISQLQVVLSIFIVGLFNSDVMSIFKSNNISNLTIIKPLIFILMFVYILIILGISYTSKKRIKIFYLLILFLSNFFISNRIC